MVAEITRRFEQDSLPTAIAREDLLLLKKIDEDTFVKTKLPAFFNNDRLLRQLHQLNDFVDSKDTNCARSSIKCSNDRLYVWCNFKVAIFRSPPVSTTDPVPRVATCHAFCVIVPHFANFPAFRKYFMRDAICPAILLSIKFNIIVI